MWWNSVSNRLYKLWMAFFCSPIVSPLFSNITNFAICLHGNTWVLCSGSKSYCCRKSYSCTLFPNVPLVRKQHICTEINCVWREIEKAVLIVHHNLLKKLRHISKFCFHIYCLDSVNCWLLRSISTHEEISSIQQTISTATRGRMVSAQHSWSVDRGFETHCCHTVISLGKIWTRSTLCNAVRQEGGNV